MDYVVRIYKNWKLHSEFTQLVSQMDEDRFFNEKQSIRESGRSLKKYGSTCNHVRNSEILIRHEIEKNDTLQGISLKYGCTTEQIRRANRLFASDSLFLRQYLMIPVEKGSPYYPKDDRPNSLPPRASSITGYPMYSRHQLQQQNSQQQYSNNNNNNKNNNSISLESVTPLSPEEENKRNIDEFLGKIDTAIAESRKYVSESQKNIDFISSQSDDDIFTKNSIKQQRRPHSSSSTTQTSASSSSSIINNHARQGSSGSSNNSDTQHLVVMKHGRHIQTSLQKLEKQQDEFFEL